MGHKPLLRHRAYIRYFSLLVITLTSDTTCIHSSMITYQRGQLSPFYLALNWLGTTSSDTSLSTIKFILKWKNIGKTTKLNSISHHLFSSTSNIVIITITYLHLISLIFIIQPENSIRYSYSP